MPPSRSVHRVHGVVLADSHRGFLFLSSLVKALSLSLSFAFLLNLVVQVAAAQDDEAHQEEARECEITGVHQKPRPNSRMSRAVVCANS